MATMEYGTSSPQVKGLQQILKQGFGYAVPTDGSFDDKTMAAVEDLGQKIGFPVNGTKIDTKFMAAMKEALVPRTKVVINGKEAWVTKAQYATLMERAGKNAGDAVKGYVAMAAEAKMLWEAHDKARKDNWFWSKAVDVAVGTKFPAKSVIDAAERAAKKMEADARACKLTPQQLGSASAPIRQAFADMDQYREELFGGGAELIKNLELIRDGCVLTLQITAAVATGGASWQVQVGVSAGVAAYEAALKEVDNASKTANYSIETGVVNVFMAAVVDGTVGLILKGGKLGPFLDKVADEAVKKAGSAMLKKFAIKAVNGGCQQMIEDGIKGLPGIADPKKKFTFDDFLKAAVESFVKGAGLKILGPVCEKYGKKLSPKLKEELFQGLGKVKIDDAAAEGIKKTIENVAPKIAQATIDAWDPKKDPNKLEPEIQKAILADPSVQKAYKDAQKK